MLDLDLLKISWDLLPGHKVKPPLKHDTVLRLLTCAACCFAVELPVLDNEIYHAVKPGLSSYKDNPEEVRLSVHTLTSGVNGL